MAVASPSSSTASSFAVPAAAVSNVTAPSVDLRLEATLSSRLRREHPPSRHHVRRPFPPLQGSWQPLYHCISNVVLDLGEGVG
jgi:hypothetical protein